MAQSRIARNLVADDQQPQVPIHRMLLNFAPQHRERLHQPGDVFLRIGSAYVQQERIMDAVAVQHALDLGRIDHFAARAPAGSVKRRDRARCTPRASGWPGFLARPLRRGRWPWIPPSRDRPAAGRGADKSAAAGCGNRRLANSRVLMSWMVTRYGLGISSGTAFNGIWNRSALQLAQKQSIADLGQAGLRAFLGRGKNHRFKIRRQIRRIPGRPARW